MQHLQHHISKDDGDKPETPLILVLDEWVCVWTEGNGVKGSRHGTHTQTKKVGGAKKQKSVCVCVRIPCTL